LHFIPAISANWSLEFQELTAQGDNVIIALEGWTPLKENTIYGVINMSVLFETK